MIIGIAVMLIVGLILATGWWVEVNKNRKLEGKWFAETIVSSELRNERHHEWERANLAEEQVIMLKTELSERPLPVQPEESETGSFVRSQAMRRATPETYRNVFDLDVNGQRVIDHLQLTFANKSTYVRGGQDAERESCFKAGQATVVGFILNQINKANDPNYKDEVND